MNNPLPLETIEKVVLKHFDLTSRELLIKSRKTIYREPRQIFQFLATKYSNFSLAAIGNYKKRGFDHATVIHSRKTIQNIFDTDKSFRETIQMLFFQLDFIRENIPESKSKVMETVSEIIQDMVFCDTESELKTVLEQHLNKLPETESKAPGEGISIKIIEPLKAS